MKTKPDNPWALPFPARLMKWYQSQGRHHLPWRGRFDPYRVWVSEFMLQQTTVAAVIPYFHRFLAVFPNFHAVARAPLEKVLTHWAGLGYYARARHMWRASGIIVRKHGGRLPDSPGALMALPGVGPYTAGALLSFAWNRPEPVVDGNVARILARVLGIKDNVKAPATVRRLWALAADLVPRNSARHWNSALLDFGALVCRPANPDCTHCPVSRLCWAHIHGAVDRLPVMPARTRARPVRMDALALRRHKGWLVRRRPPGGLWGGLWEFPWVERADPPGPGARDWHVPVGVVPARLKHQGALRHNLSHRRLHVTLWGGTAPRPVSRRKGYRWVSLEALSKMAVSTLTHRLIRLIH